MTRWIISWVVLFMVLNPLLGRVLLVVGISRDLIARRHVPFSAFSFPRWQSVLLTSLIGMLLGGAVAVPPGMSSALLWRGVVAGWIFVWAWTLLIVSILHWWLKRGGRWDGQGDLFNLTVASWLVVNAVGASFIVAGAPPLFTSPLWLYAIWVSAQAMKNAIPGVSRSYCLAGFVIALISAMLACWAISAVLAALDISPLPVAALAEAIYRSSPYH